MLSSLLHHLPDLSLPNTIDLDLVLSIHIER